MADNFGLKIGVEGERQFKQALAEINQAFKTLGSEMHLVTAQFDKNDKSAAALAARSVVLSKEIDTQKEKINTLRTALDNATASFGENDRRTQNWQVQLNKAEAELIGMEKELNANNKALMSNSDKYDALGKEIADTVKEYVKVRKEYGENSAEAKTLEKKLADLTGEHKEAGKAADAEEKEITEVTKSLGLYKRGTGEATEETGKFAAAMDALKNIGKVVVGAVAAVGTAATAVGVGMYKMAEGAANAGREVNITSQKLGMSRQGFQEWDFILRKSGTSMDVMNVGMKTLQRTMGGMTEDGDKSSKAFAAIGLSFDEVKGKSPEEALNITIKALQEMPAGADRTAAALKLFGRGAMELQPLLNKTAAETDELRQRAHDLGLVLSDEQINAAGVFRSAMGKIRDTMEGMKLQIASSLVPAFADGLSAFMDFANGVEGGEAKMKSAVDNITKAITETLPVYVEKGAQMVSALVQGLSQALPGIAAAVADVLPLIIGVLTAMLPTLIDTIMGAVPLIVNSILSMLPSVAEAAVKIILALADGLAKMLPTLVPTALNAVVTIIKTVIKMLPDVILAGADIIKSLAKGLGNAIPLLKPITAAISGVIDVIKTIAPFVLAAAAAFAAFKIISTITNMMKGMTLATIAQTVATNIQTVATTIATAVQWLLNAAMLANPIGLLIAGVAALAAGIAVLCIWFNRESEEEKRLKEQTKKLIEENDKLNESIGNTKDAYDDKTASMERDANAAKSLADKVAELSAKENKSAEEKRKLAAYVGMLNEAMGETVVTYNEETDCLSENMDAIYARIAAMKEEARAQAARERAVEIAKEQMAVEEQLNKVLKQKDELIAAYDAGTIKTKTFNKEMEKLYNSYTELLGTQDDLAVSFENTTAIVAECAEKQAEANQAIIDSTDGLSDELQAAYDLQEELAQKRIEKEQEVTDAMTLAASQQGLTLDEYKEKLKETEKALETYTNAATEMFKKMNDKAELSVSEMTENMKHNQSVLETWSDNLVALADKGIDQGLLERLKKAGPESAGTVAALVKASDKELKELNDVFANGSKVATDALMKQLGMSDVVDSGSDMVDDIASGVKDNKGLETAATELIKTAKQVAASTVSSSNFNDIGVALVEGVWKGMSQKEPWFRSQVNSFFKNVVNNVKSALGIASPSKVFAQIGGFMAEGIGVGFENEMDDVSKAMQDAIPTKLDAPDLEIDTGINAALNGAGVAVSIADLGIKLDGIAAIMTQMFPALLQALNIKVVLDDGTLVGRLTPEIDKNLGLLQRKRAIMGV